MGSITNRGVIFWFILYITTASAAAHTHIDIYHSTVVKYYLTVVEKNSETLRAKDWLEIYRKREYATRCRDLYAKMLYIGLRFNMKAIPDSKAHVDNKGPIWGRMTQVGPMLAPWTLLSGRLSTIWIPIMNIQRTWDRPIFLMIISYAGTFYWNSLHYSKPPVSHMSLTR